VKSADRVLATVEFVADHGSVRFQDIVNGLALAAALLVDSSRPWFPWTNLLKPSATLFS
jgi:hypothetical protein